MVKMELQIAPTVANIEELCRAVMIRIFWRQLIVRKIISVDSYIVSFFSLMSEQFNDFLNI